MTTIASIRKEVAAHPEWGELDVSLIEKVHEKFLLIVSDEKFISTTLEIFARDNSKSKCSR